MAVSLQLHQTTSVSDGPVYTVNQSVTVATDISPAVFVFRVADSAFDHYATAADMSQYPDNRDDAVAAGQGFYRQASVSRNWDTVDDMNADLVASLARVQRLCNEWAQLSGSAIIDRTTVIVPVTE